MLFSVFLHTVEHLFPEPNALIIAVGEIDYSFVGSIFRKTLNAIKHALLQHIAVIESRTEDNWCLRMHHFSLLFA